MSKNGGTGATARRERLAASLPPASIWLGGALSWGLAMALSAIFSLFLLNRLPVARLDDLVLLYFSGGLLGWFLALPMIRFCGHARAAETRFAAAFLFLGLGTVLVTALLFATHYRLFYAQWHAPFGSRIWVHQFVFTSAGAVYQFAVLGLRLAFPLALVFLVAASLHLARARR